MFRCHHCGVDFPSHLARVEHTLDLITEQGVKIMGALENLQAADAGLKDTVTTFLADIAGKLDGHEDPAIQAVADEINAEIAAMKAVDPGNPGTGGGDDTTPPADSGAGSADAGATVDASVPAAE